MHLRKEDKRRGEGWIIFLYNNQPKFAYTCGEDIDVPFLQLQHHQNEFGAAWLEFCLYDVHI